MTVARPEMVTSIPWDEFEEPTVQQLADWLVRATVAEREWWVARMRERVADADRCFVENHEGRLRNPPPRYWTPWGIVG